MSELTFTLLKLGFLAVLWLFVLSAVSVMRTDVFGTKVSSTKKRRGTKNRPKGVKKRRRRGQPNMLVIVDGPNRGQSVPLGEEQLLLGRGTDAAIRLDDDYVSTRHARFVTNGEQWFVEDLGSTNGTYIGNRRVTEPTPVDLGLQVRLGKTIVELRK